MEPVFFCFKCEFNRMNISSNTLDNASSVFQKMWKLMRERAIIGGPGEGGGYGKGMLGERRGGGRWGAG